ncbi:undecaprenyl-phosphate glucose phosphotransferase [Cyanobium sp. Aljojuca 7D2]|uniref:undecaprenyl-phosphate glucose phosphotransferase n=1 Tax=Cyanobium sp. Aljojuca 7D2 TaxID=2823698 RepID=UPI0020CDDCBC|nr:undecaprenyl-phosphate glucose phosphotransferase [Cyanobium sp. Aljojuca 7D2]
MAVTPRLGGGLRLHSADLTRLQRLCDPLVVVALFLLLQRSALPAALGLPGWLWVALTTVVLLPRAGLYASYRQKSLLLLARRVTSGWLLVITTLLLITFFTKTTATVSRVDTSIWALVSWLVLLANHVGLRKLLRWHRSQGGNQRTIVYWGTPEAALAFAGQLQQNPWMGLRLVAWFSPVPPRSMLPSQHLPLCRGGINDMRHWLERNAVDRIVFSHITRDGIGMEQVLRLFGDTSVPVIYAPQWAQRAMRFSVDAIGEQPCIELWGSERSLLDCQLKRGFDLLLTSVGLVLISPLLLAIALAVALSSPGPILFAQDRYGLDGRRFRIYKFRTMRVLEAGDQPGLRQATRDDPRVTPVGRVLRRWSLDELPQLFNVLRGDMSLVGPRPHAVDHNEQYRQLIPGYMQRHAAKPGITGLAQVEGWRGETSTLEAMARRVDADLRYQRDWSLKLDIKILIKTLLRLRSLNAY